MNITQMSFSAAVLVIAITIIRAVSINRIPKKTFLVLWAVVILRLIMPFSIPSPFSVYSLIGNSTETTEKIAETPVAYIVPMTLQTQPETISMVPPSQLPQEGATKLPIQSTTDAPSPWMIVWLIGVVLCVLYFTLAYIKFYRRFQTSIITKNDYVNSWLGEHRIVRPIRVKQSGRITTPLTYGVLHPVILIPETIDWSDEKQLLYILSHEYIHIRRFDVVSKMILTAALCLHWFNPLVWVMYVLVNRDLEITCDETVVRSLGETSKSSYALTLLKLEEQRKVFAPYYSGFSRNAAEERIIAIMRYKKSSAIAIALAVLLVVGMTSAFALSATPNVDTNSLPNIEDETERLAHEAVDKVLAPYKTDGLESFIAATVNEPEIERLTQEAAAKLGQYNIDDIKASIIASLNESKIEQQAQEAVTAALALYFESYSGYDLILNKADGRLYYKSQLVRCFSQNYIECVVNHDGVIDVNAVRNSSGELVSVEPYSRQDFVRQTKAILREPSSAGFDEIWARAKEAVYSGVVFWPIPDGQKEPDWNYAVWSAVWNEEWQKAEAGGYLEQLRGYVVNKLIIAADDSGSWRNLYQKLYESSIGLLER